MEISNPNKVIFPAVGLTKADLVGHYERVGPTMLEFLAGRPLTLQRFPNGVDAKGFMQKNAAKHFPASIARFRVPKRNGGVTEYAVVTHADDLAYLANQGTITFHMWTATAAEPDRPDWMILDLDPEANDLDGVRFATIAARDLLAEFALEGFALATGSKGFHIWVRLDGNTPFGDVSLVDPSARRHRRDSSSRATHDRVLEEGPRRASVRGLAAQYRYRDGRGPLLAEAPTKRSRCRASDVDELEHTNPDQWTLTDLGDRLSINKSLPAQALPVADIISAALAAGIDLETPHDRFGRRR